jgi:hypothetical protein
MYWRPGNMVPADSPAPVPAASAAPGQNPRAATYARLLAGQVVRKETERIKALAQRYADDGMGWEAKVGEFYAEMTEEIGRRCDLDPETAKAYTEGARSALLEAGAGMVETWSETKIEGLVGLMLEEAR